MSFDDHLADRTRHHLAKQKGLIEKKMFGGIGFLLNGNMCCGVLGDELIVRLNPEKADEVLAQKHTRIFDFSGRPMKGWIFVDPKGLAKESDLQTWLEIALEYAKNLPVKT